MPEDGLNAKPGRGPFAIIFAIAAAAVGCEQAETAGRRPDVPFEPTPHHVVGEMLKLAKVRADDVVYDLGCGDGRIVIGAARQHGARAVCVDIDPRRVRESQPTPSAPA